MWSPRERTGQETVSDKRDQMGMVLLKKAEMLCGILPHSPFFTITTACLREFVYLYHSTRTLVAGANLFFLLSCSFVRNQQITLTR